MWDWTGKEELEQYVKGHHLEKNIQFAGFRSDVHEILQCADCFVLSSFREGLSVALMEAMTEGLPVVCSRIRGNVDLIEEGVGGYLVAPGEESEYRIAFTKLYEMKKNEPQKFEKTGQANQCKIKEFSKENVDEIMKKVISGVSNMFSVIIPAYNSEKTIEKTLDSLQNQTKPELIQEVIIINDGSTDGTKDKVEQYKSRQDCILNIILYNQQNAGVAAARNAGIRMATADYLAFLDSDDCWAPEKLEWQEKNLKENPQIDLLCGGLEEGPLRISAKRLFVTSVIAERILHKERYIYLNRCDTQGKSKRCRIF